MKHAIKSVVLGLSLFLANGSIVYAQDLGRSFTANQNYLAVQAETGEQQSIAETEEALLEFATSNSVIGLNPAYVEKRLGIPRIKNAWSLQFELGGCTIDYRIEGSEVKTFYVSISQKCQPTIDGTRITERTTFGELKQNHSAGEFVASCLRGCGNIEDPVIMLEFPGLYNSYKRILYRTDYDQSREAMDVWAKSINKKLGREDDSYDDLELFSDAKDPPREITENLRTMTVKEVIVGDARRP
jgi:hypothetical protein